MLIGIVEDQIGTCREAAQVHLRHLAAEQLRLFAHHLLPLFKAHIEHVLRFGAVPWQQHGTHQITLIGEFLRNIMKRPR